MKIKLFYIVLLSTLFNCNTTFSQLQNSVYSMVTPYLLNFFTFYSETEGFFLQSFNPKLNVEESFNQYISFFKY